MDSPLTTAELARLRKAINQRERLLSQGLSTTVPESNITRALSNLRLYLSQSKPHLAAVLKDWESADQSKKSQIIVWLKQNILGDQAAGVPIFTPEPTPPSQSSAPRPKFVAPPPPPPLPAKTQSLPSQWQSAPCSQGESATAPPSNLPTRDASPKPLPTPINSYLRHSISLGQTQIRSTPTPPLRELHTQAVLKPPTPPPKDHHHLRSASIRRTSGPAAVEQLTLSARELRIAPSMNEAQLGFSASPVASGFPAYPETPSPSGEDRPDVSYATRPQASFNVRASTHPQTEPTQPHVHHTHSFSGYPATSQPQSDFTTQLLSQTASAQQQYYQHFLSQVSQSSSHNTNQFLELMKKYQEYYAQSQPQFTSQPTGNSNGGDSFAQLLAVYQQQYQQQTNQIITALQQQQPTTSFDPSQLLAQSQQQNQDFTNLLSQMQANSSAQIFNQGQNTDFANMLAQMQANTPGLDNNSLMSGIGGGGANTDWTAVAGMMLSGADPTGVAGMAMQGAGLF